MITSIKLPDNSIHSLVDENLANSLFLTRTLLYTISSGVTIPAHSSVVKGLRPSPLTVDGVQYSAVAINNLIPVVDNYYTFIPTTTLCMNPSWYTDAEYRFWFNLYYYNNTDEDITFTKYSVTLIWLRSDYCYFPGQPEDTTDE